MASSLKSLICAIHIPPNNIELWNNACFLYVPKETLKYSNSVILLEYANNSWRSVMFPCAAASNAVGLQNPGTGLAAGSAKGKELLMMESSFLKDFKYNNS